MALELRLYNTLTRDTEPLSLRKPGEATVDDKGAPVKVGSLLVRGMKPGVPVQITGDQKDFRLVSDAEGKALFTDLKPGSYEVTAGGTIAGNSKSPAMRTESGRPSN